MMRTLKLVYFAWVRERTGFNEETVEYSENLTTIAELIDHMKTGSEAHASAFDDVDKLRFALDQDFVEPDHPIGDAKELAIFPPVTGG